MLAQDITIKNDLSSVFNKYNVHGCFLIENLCDENRIIVNSSRIDSAFLPASTFKIPHALIALETGIADGGEFTIEWDGVERSVKSWNRTHNFTSAIQNSAVWYFEEIARRIGKETLKDWLVEIDYGNKKVSGTDPFWLRGNLRITPNQQLEFMKKFYNESLPFKEASYKIVKNAILLEENDSSSFYGKTGWVTYNNREIGWVVGYVEDVNGTYIYVTNVVGVKDNSGFANSRMAVTKELLGELNIYQ